MPQKQSTVAGLVGGADRLRQILAQRQMAEIEAQNEQYKRQMEAEKMALEGRRVAATELGAQTAADVARQPKAPTISTITGLVNAEGQPITQGRGPNGEVVWTADAYVKPETPPKAEKLDPAEKFFAAFASTRGKTVDTLTDKEWAQANTQWHATERAPQQGTGGTATADAGTIALARDAALDPAILDGLTKADYGKVMRVMAENGEIKTSAQQAARQQASEALTALREVAAMPGLKAAIGMSSMANEWMVGTPQHDAHLKINELRARLVLPRMGIMKGVLSNSDIELLKQSTTALQQAMSEQGFLAEMKKLEGVLERAARGSAQQQNGAPPSPQGGSGRASGAGASTGKFVVKAPDGTSHPFDTQAQADAARARWGVR